MNEIATTSKSLQPQSGENAWNDVAEGLIEGETVEAVVFGPWGWGSGSNPEDWYGFPSHLKVPPIGKVLTIEQAMPFFNGWSFNGGFGAPSCFAVQIFTDRQIMTVTQYDGSTWLSGTPRNPVEGVIPSMEGG